MKQPEGYIQEGKENKVCLLNKLFFGLTQSPNQWYKRFDSFIIKTKYNQCEYNYCVYFKQSDDMLITMSNKTHVQKLKAQLKKEFDMKDLGEAKKILGIELPRDIRGELCSQGVREIQHGRRKTSHHSFGTSLQIILQVVPTITEEEEMSRVPYASVV